MDLTSVTFSSPAPVEVMIEAVAITVGPQTSDPVEVQFSAPRGGAPVDNLESDSATSSLAARQGKVLDGKNAQLRTDVGNHDSDFAAYYTSLLA